MNNNCTVFIRFSFCPPVLGMWPIFFFNDYPMYCTVHFNKKNDHFIGASFLLISSAKKEETIKIARKTGKRSNPPKSSVTSFINKTNSNLTTEEPTTDIENLLAQFSGTNSFFLFNHPSNYCFKMNHNYVDNAQKGARNPNFSFSQIITISFWLLFLGIFYIRLEALIIQLKFGKKDVVFLIHYKSCWVD